MNNLCDTELLESCQYAIDHHDESKYNIDEFYPYLNYFYPSPGYPKDQVAFDWAWLLHQRRNPHHWQHWVLIRDSGNMFAFDMPFEECCNMVCDWHSFSSKDAKSTAYRWYQDNKKEMILSVNSRAIVEDLIEYLKEPLSSR